MEFMETTCILTPDDVLEEILVRVPVKSLLRLKCVSKHWYSLIGDYYFAKKHYHFQYAMLGADKDAGSLFLDSPQQDSESDRFYLLSKHGSDDVVLDITSDLQRDVPSTFSNDCELHNQDVRCIGIANGVICLLWGTTRLALWNPATREFKNVARWPVIPDNEVAEKYSGEIYSLAFDPQSNDFKILGLINFYGENDVGSIFEFHLYSLKSNSWKRIEKGLSGHPTLFYSDRDACLNGVYYCITRRDNVQRFLMILCFDFKSENFKEFDPPWDYMCRNNQHTFDERVWCGCEFGMNIGKYKERLALFVTRTLENRDRRFEIWAVTKFREDDDGVPMSWEVEIIVEPIHSFNWSLDVQAFRACGDLLVMVQRGNSFEDEEVCLYDPSTHTYNNLGLAISSCLVINMRRACFLCLDNSPTSVKVLLFS